MSDIDFEAEVVRLKLPLSMKTGQACRIMDVGPTKLRELIAEGEIDGRKRGKDLIIRTASILRYNANLPRAEFAFRPKKTKDVSTAA
jgi:Helix-turn-helix domain